MVIIPAGFYFENNSTRDGYPYLKRKHGRLDEFISLVNMLGILTRTFYAEYPPLEGGTLIIYDLAISLYHLSLNQIEKS